MFRSLRSRLLLTYLLMISLVLALTGAGLILFLLQNPLLERQIVRDLNFVAAIISIRDERRLISVPRDRLRPALRSLGLPEIRFLVLDREGQVLSDTGRGAPLPSEEELARLADSDPPLSGRFRDTTGGLWLYAARSFASGEAVVVMTPRPRLQVLRLLGGDLLTPVLRAGFAAFILSLVLAWLISRWVAAPLQQMSQAARSVAAGEYQDRPRPAGPQEVQNLALAFNSMVQKVQASQQSQRDLVANVSHELKTPLTSIQGFAQAILDGTAESPEALERAARVIHDESDRLSRLVQDLLDLARLDAGQIEFHREIVDLREILDAIRERQLLPAAEKGVQLEMRIPDLPTIIGDGDRLVQVFTNLLDNAINHTPPGGTVMVSGEAGGGSVVVHVEDEGPGIPEQERPRIFERFYQLDKARAGSRTRGAGLGLAITHEIVQAHGGNIAVTTRNGPGSRFSVRFPVAGPENLTLARNAA